MDIDSRKERFELVEAIVLSVAIVATAWSAYQAARWSGVQSLRLAETSAAGRTAMEKHLFGQEQMTGDAVGSMQVMNALVEGKQNIVEFYVTRMRIELRVAVEAWLALKPLTNASAPAHPLLMPQYTEGVIGPLRAEERTSQEESERLLGLAHDAKTNSDKYVLFGVLLASVLFFVGIAGKFHPGHPRRALLFLASITLAVLIGLILRAPIASG